MNFAVWLINLNVNQCWLLLCAVIFGIFCLMSLLSYITKDTIDSHFDRFTIMYLIIFFLTVAPLLLLIIYKYSAAMLGITIASIIVLVAIFANASGPRYLRYGKVVYGSGNTSFLSKYWRRRQLRMRRRDALRKAKAFISPYRNIFGKLVLSNKYCKIVFSKENGLCKFFCMGKEYNSKKELPFFEAKAIDNSVWNEEFFNSLCFNFTYNTKLENVKNIFTKDRFMIDDKNYDISKPIQKKSETSKPNPNETSDNQVQKILEQINVNEATEAELTALPGINIVMAKKIIQQRDYKGEFKSVNDFIAFVKIKPHFEKKLREMVTVQPIQQNIIQKGERILDIDE